MNDQAKTKAQLLQEIFVLNQKIKKLEKTEAAYTQAKEVLRDSEEMYRLVIENARETIIIAQDSMLVFVNRAAVDMMGYSEKILTSRSFADFIHPNDRNMVMQHYKRRINAEDVPPVYSFRVLKQDGSVRVVEINAAVIQWKGRPATLNFLNDITERKHAETALREKSEELDRYFTLSLDLLCIANIDGHFIRLNPEWEKVLGYSLSELEGRLFLDLVHPDDMESTLAAVSKLSAQQQVLSFENRYICKDGSYRWIEWRSHPQGELIYAAARDITERKREEEERKRLIAELNKTLSHVKKLSGLLPICASCKKIRDDKGYWKQLEVYISEHSDALFSHSYCPECGEKYLQEIENIANKCKE
jgi:PAS domain S-box-containing protein